MNALKRKLLILCLPILICDIAAAKIEVVLGIPLAKNLNLPGIIPDATTSEIIVSREQYVLSYNKERRSPNWVAWKLEAHQMGSSGRTNDFQEDKDLEHFLNQAHSTYEVVAPGEFSGSCYDRGHQIPSADRTDTSDNNRATFIMSNIVPQTPFLNRGLWQQLEQHTRTLVKRDHKKVYVIAGPIYGKNYGSIGPKKDIPIPSMNFKILLVLDANQSLKDINEKTPMVAVIMPNTHQDGTVLAESPFGKCPTFSPEIVASDDWKKFSSSLAEIEASSGLRIFSQLPAENLQ